MTIILINLLISEVLGRGAMLALRPR